MQRKLFCELSPTTYKISTKKSQLIRKLQNQFSDETFATTKTEHILPIKLYTHKSLIRRKLGNVDLQLQENKATNLTIAAPKINTILIKPQETFSFWALVGSCTKQKGYQPGLTISNGTITSGTGGGMCQFTNLLHWIILHSPLTITEHHHHNQYDLFPDFGRQVPFGTGTSIVYNYMDYRFKNNTSHTFQLLVSVGEEYLCGELHCDSPISMVYHVKAEDEYFYQTADAYYRHNIIYRTILESPSGKLISKEKLIENNAKVMYDSSFIKPSQLKDPVLA